MKILFKYKMAKTLNFSANIILKSCRYIRKPEWHYLVFKITIVGFKHGLLFITFFEFSFSDN